MGKKTFRQRLLKLFEEASFLGFAIILIGSSIVLASNISNHSYGALPNDWPQGRLVLDNNLALSVEVVGRNEAAVDEATGNQLLYNGEKTDLRVYFRAESGDVTAGSRAALQLPQENGAHDVFFAGNTSPGVYPQTVSILSAAGNAVGSATIQLSGLVEMTFSHTLPEGEGGVFMIDGQNIFILLPADMPDAAIPLEVGNPGSATPMSLLAVAAHVLSNEKGLGLTSEQPDWIGASAYGDGVQLSLDIPFHGGFYGIADGDLLQVRLPADGSGEHVTFSQAIPALNVTANGAFIGAATLSEHPERETVDLNVIFNPPNAAAAQDIREHLSFPVRCRYAPGYTGGEALYGVPVFVTGSGVSVLTRPTTAN